VRDLDGKNSSLHHHTAIPTNSTLRNTGKHTQDVNHFLEPFLLNNLIYMTQITGRLKTVSVLTAMVVNDRTTVSP